MFLDLYSKEKETKAKINKWNLIKLKSLHSKGNHQENKRKPTEWEKYL